MPFRHHAIAGRARSRRTSVGAGVAVPRSSRGGRRCGSRAAFPDRNPADAITAFHPLARIAWFARRQPEAFASVGAVLEPKDFLNFRLTGEIAADSVTYSRYDYLRAAEASAPGLARTLCRSPRAAPGGAVAVLGSDEPAIRLEPPCRYSRVRRRDGCVGLGGGLGRGPRRPGLRYRGHVGSRRADHARRVPTCRASFRCSGARGLRQIGGPTQAGADCVLWCHRTFAFAVTLAAAVERAGKMPPAEDRPLFLPYLAGERTPIWRADVRGAFEGLARGHDADDFLWAVLEGVAMAMRDILARAVDGSEDELSRSSRCRRRRAIECLVPDQGGCHEVPMVRTAHRETGLIGAAIAAAVGLGWHASLAAAATRCAPSNVSSSRAPALAPVYAERAERYGRARQHAIAQGRCRDASRCRRRSERMRSAKECAR